MTDHKITVRKLEGLRLEGDKRQYAPLAIDWFCEGCGETRTHDMSDYHLSYPIWGEPVELILYCHKCEEDGPTLTIVPEITIAIVEGSKSGD